MRAIPAFTFQSPGPCSSWYITATLILGYGMVKIPKHTRGEDGFSQNLKTEELDTL